MLYSSLQACGSRGKALLEKAIRNSVSQRSHRNLNICGLLLVIYWRLILFIFLVWCSLLGKAAEEQCVGQCSIMGSEDFVCGRYPFDYHEWWWTEFLMRTGKSDSLLFSCNALNHCSQQMALCEWLCVVLCWLDILP